MTEVSSEVSTSADSEDSVRLYLRWLRDPKSVCDDSVIEGLKSRISDETLDEIERLRLYSELERAERCDGNELEAAFIASAKSFAHANEIEVAAFRRMDVPPEVLRRAGLVNSPRTKSRTARSTTRVGSEEFVSSLPDGDFTVEDVVSTTGGTAGTIRARLKKLAEDGAIQLVGTERGRRGKPANKYRRK